MGKRAIAVCCVLAALLSACGGGAGGTAEAPETPPAEESAGVSFTDDLGRTVSVPELPRRVAVLIGSFADIWCLAGGKDTLVAAAGDAWTQFDLDLGPEVADLGGVKEISTERLFAARPDLVIASSNTAADVALLDLLEEAGLTAAYFNVSSFPDYLRMLDICTQLTGHPENYQRYGAGNGGLSGLCPAGGRGGVCVEMNMGRVFLVGAGCGGADLITLRGLSALRGCQAVVYDDLIDRELLAFAPEDAERFYMGKRGGRPSAAQEDICELLVRLAREGRTVVRLKGGDPFVFGRGLSPEAAGAPCADGEARRASWTEAPEIKTYDFRTFIGNKNQSS